MSEWTIADELALQSVRLARVALLCAQAVAYPGLKIDRSMAELHELAGQAAGYVAADDPPHYRGLLLAEFLFSRLAFRGNQDEYDDPRNSFLNDVLDRKLGLPITLSILYLDIAERLQIPAYGVGLPGHFIVGVADMGQVWYFDPFHGGGRLSSGECARLVELTTGYQGPFQAHWLAPQDPGAITARLLNNLRATYSRRKQWDEALSVLKLLQLVQPDMPEHYRDLGLIHFRRGSTFKAARYLEAYLQRSPDAEDAHTIREGMADSLDGWARLN